MNDWTLLGEAIGKIFADVLLKNPFMSSWTFYNSDVIGPYLYTTSDHQAEEDEDEVVV